MLILVMGFFFEIEAHERDGFCITYQKDIKKDSKLFEKMYIGVDKYG
jgi:hypothetical protein